VLRDDAAAVAGRTPASPPYQVDEAPQPVLPVKELQHGAEGEGDGEEHGGVAAAGRVRALQQPQRVADHVRQDGVGQHAHLEGEDTPINTGAHTHTLIAAL